MTECLVDFWAVVGYSEFVDGHNAAGLLVGQALEVTKGRGVFACRFEDVSDGFSGDVLGMKWDV